jgi:hypothetical protein
MLDKPIVIWYNTQELKMKGIDTMLCARELQKIADQKHEEQKAKNLILEAVLRKQKYERTLKWCEILGEQLITRANEGKSITTELMCTIGYLNILKATTSEYADHRESHYVVDGCIDIEQMKEWFAQYCFEVVTSRSWYWAYGYGQRACNRIKIRPKPKC